MTVGHYSRIFPLHLWPRVASIPGALVASTLVLKSVEIFYLSVSPYMTAGLTMSLRRCLHVRVSPGERRPFTAEGVSEMEGGGSGEGRREGKRGGKGRREGKRGGKGRREGKRGGKGRREGKRKECQDRTEYMEVTVHVDDVVDFS
ncbi:hypothetical protein RRG08_031340 [Elysia crispata]|uniref:Uncharacterized protein n=1 Tax=Elysia crispata TaxID=231223 RepID=A0AAE0YI42_9GAST|nr:hypothetical protein RRG08_031340 [Elysia crispata]